MGKLTNRDNFYARDQGHEISNIISPLDRFSVSFFNHIRIFSDLSRKSLSNRPDWLEHFFNMEYYDIGCFSNHPCRDKGIQHILWLDLLDDGVMSDARVNFNIADGYTIIKNNGAFRDIFLFASSPEIHLTNFYLNHRDILEHFTDYYLDKANPIIQKTCSDLYIPEITEKTSLKPFAHSNLDLGGKIKAFYRDTQIKKYYYCHDGRELSITPRQRDCIKLLLKGKNIKELAKELNIQYGTVATHLNSIKLKFNFPTTRSMLDAFREILG